MASETFVLLHQGLLTAIYHNKSDLVKTIQDLEWHLKMRNTALQRYSVYVMTESIQESAVYINPKRVPIEELLSKEKPAA